MSDLVPFLEAEWEKPDGFFGKVREGNFDEDHGEQVLAKIREFNFKAISAIDKRLVALLWYIPLFLGWQTKRVAEKGGDVVAYERFEDRMLTVLQEGGNVPSPWQCNAPSQPPRRAIGGLDSSFTGRILRNELKEAVAFIAAKTHIVEYLLKTSRRNEIHGWMSFHRAERHPRIHHFRVLDAPE
jgi:hypothetical protein